MDIKGKISLNEYQEMCKRTAVRFENKDKEIMSWGLGVAGEAGDIAGCIKKTVSHKNDQRDGIKENLGDTMWYMAMICNFYGWNFEKILEENIEKLEKRYPAGFDYKNAQRGGNRIDWNENN